MRSLLILERFKNNNGWWSVSNTNSLPYKYGSSRFTAHTNAEHSRSIVENLVSAGINFRLKYITGIFTPSYSWLRTAPMSSCDASVVKMNSLSNWGSRKMGCCERRLYNSSYASSDLQFHLRTSGSPFLVMSVNGLAAAAKFSMDFL